MVSVKVDLSENLGRVRPLHAVNNGPVYKFTVDQRITNIDAFRDAGIPFARTHDASFCAAYGGEHTVDVHAVFPDFSKDENDPASYDFVLTDEYMRVMEAAGVKPFYRLGSKIEHWPVKYGTLPPPDFDKWARICEHIIRHFTEGWADGYHFDIPYWEIWNEADIVPDDAPLVDKKTWGGTKAQFFDFFDRAARHLKTCFPHLKIGGPAVANPIKPWTRAFLEFCRSHDTPLDFFSWHCYPRSPLQLRDLERFVRDMLDEYGFTRTESILNEWNYVIDWTGDQWLYSLRTEKNLKGASFIAGCMALATYQPVDMLMYYDARPCAMNGMFNTDFVCDKLKGYWPFYMFNKLYKLGTAVPFTAGDDSIMGCAARNARRMAMMITHFDDVDQGDPKTLRLELAGLPGGPMKVSYYVLDEANDVALTREEIVSGTDATLFPVLPLFTTCFITVEPV